MSPSTSPFPPIADYGFLSDCHTGALVAPDGSVDWLCLPAFDSASVFGNILDRGAGSFRFGPYGINVPTQRTYVPGTNVLTTTWHTPGGWLVVHDALVMGPRQGPDTVTPHTRPPADDDAAHLLVRTVECLEGTVEVELVCEPAFDYGRVEANVDAGRRRRPPGRRRGRCRAGLPAQHGHVDRHRGRHRPRPPRADQGRHGVLRPVLGRGADVTRRCRRSRRPRRGHGQLLAQLAGPRPDPRPRPAAPPRAVGPDHQGPHLHADRSDRGGADDLAARDPRGRAQLGLPLHLDARHHVHAAGAALPEPRLGGRRVHAVRRRPRAQPGRRPADHVRHRRTSRPHRVHPRRAVGLRGCPPGPTRERRLRPAPERRVRRRPRLPPAAHPAQPAPAPTAVAARAVAGGRGDRRLARARPGDLGGARQAAALRVVQADGLGRARPRRQAGRHP